MASGREIAERSAGDGFTRVPAEAAYRTSATNKSAKWPSRPNSERIEPRCAPAFDPTFKLIESETIFTIGSCFARHIEIELKKHGYSVPAFDFDVPQEELWSGTFMKSGVLNKYTPHSMLNEIQYAFSDREADPYLVEYSEGRHVDLQLHVDKPVPYERAVERRRQVQSLYRRCISEARIIIITLGLAETWWDSRSEIYLNETPSRHLIGRHNDRFFFEVMSPSATIGCTTEILRILKERGRADQRVILTVSPVPFNRTFTEKDAIVANSYSKAVLRVAAECAVRQFPHVDYFPSFESVMNTARDIAWENDQIHVTQQMVAFNVQRMLEQYR